VKGNPLALSGAFAALSIDAVQLRGLIPRTGSLGCRLVPSPPAKQATAREDQTRQDLHLRLDRIEGNGVRVVICEDASRFARELVTQELGIIALIRRGVRVLTASGDGLTDSSDPSRKMMRQIAGSFAEYEKARLVAKLRAARERKRTTSGKCEGRKAWAEINPELLIVRLICRTAGCRMHGRTSRGAPRGKLKRVFRALLQQSCASVILEELGITDIAAQRID
jgi:DNA invertase Pin-like site-specific DNA recombinase